ncbi:toxin-antitoxin system YwqK family antitoxin [Flagellimonas sp. S174]|uniref:toxin-antitoxin system YwqK family antitoxin n=1 Tax=Flagellimonas sp. S174 TaxID=3410790 RepID=UPI003BF4C6A8
MLRVLLLSIFFIFPFSINKEYHREYHNNGEIKAQGWKKGDSKEDFWKFYFPNGKIKEQGHFKNNLKVGYWYFYNKDGKLDMEGHYVKGSMVKWWLFYDENGKINHKCQLHKGVKNGYCLKYKNEKLKSAQKYSNGKKIKEWYDFRSFKKENKLSDLK